MAAATSPELTAYYYRDNFLRLCDSVEKQYGDLLDADEAAYLEKYRALPFDAQCLYVRLISRAGPWFRESKLRYPEIKSIDAAVDTLIGAGFACRAAELSVDEITRLFTLDELRRSFASWPELAARGSKRELLPDIEALALEGETLLAAVAPCEPLRIIAPLHSDYVALLQLLFFGNRYQTMTEFLLQDMGVVRYFPYSLDRSHRLFPDRAALDEYLHLAGLTDRYYAIAEVEADIAAAATDLAAEVLASEPAYESSHARRDKLCNSLARDLERFGQLTPARALYEASARHPARERRARILEKTDKLPEAFELCQHIMDAPWCEAEFEAAQRILPRVRKKLEGTPQPRRKETFEELRLTLANEDSRVELLAAREFAAQGWQVHYVENTLMNGLFGLAFWEQIFAALPGAFSHPYQGAPLDMYERSFNERRRVALRERFHELSAADLPALLSDAYTRYEGFQCHWTNWKHLDRQLVETAARQIPREHLLAIFQRILFDPRENRKGFPDLIVFGEDTGNYKMIEVKGPGDALQDSQKRWLRFFREEGIPAQVAWVDWLHD